MRLNNSTQLKSSSSMGAVEIEQKDQKHPFFMVAVCDGDQEEDLGMITEENETEASFCSSLDGSDLSSGPSSSSGSLDEGATSSSSTSLRSNGSSLDLSELMSSLPIKRGLSKFYQGKSQSFTSLARVTSVEDLAKKAAGSSGGGYARRMKACRSYGGGLNLNNSQQQRGAMSCSSPRSTISKRSSPSSCLRGKINHTGLLIPANFI